jgi:hypothetical protein
MTPQQITEAQKLATECLSRSYKNCDPHIDKNQPKPETKISTNNQSISKSSNHESSFERFAFKGCVAEGKYNQSVCACNAKKLNEVLSQQEKLNYRIAADGNIAATIELLKFTDKLMKAILDCSSR